MGGPRGIYLPGYGAVISADVNLLSIVVSPFRPPLTTRSEVVKLAPAKTGAPSGLAQAAMRQVMVEAASGLGAVPANERIVVVVSLYNFPGNRAKVFRRRS